MADFMKKVTKLALKSAAVCAGVAASAALLHKYVKIQSNCSECGPSEDDFDEDRNEDDTTKNVDEAANTDLLKKNLMQFLPTRQLILLAVDISIFM